MNTSTSDRAKFQAFVNGAKSPVASCLILANADKDAQLPDTVQAALDAGWRNFGAVMATNGRAKLSEQAANTYPANTIQRAAILHSAKEIARLGGAVKSIRLDMGRHHAVVFSV